MRYRVVFEGKDEIGYFSCLPELPGCAAAGETFGETMELIAEDVGRPRVISKSSRLARRV